MNDVRASVCKPSAIKAESRYGVILSVARRTEFASSSVASLGIKRSIFWTCEDPKRGEDGGDRGTTGLVLHI